MTTTFQALMALSATQTKQSQSVVESQLAQRQRNEEIKRKQAEMADKKRREMENQLRMKTLRKRSCGKRGLSERRRSSKLSRQHWSGARKSSVARYDMALKKPSPLLQRHPGALHRNGPRLHRITVPGRMLVNADSPVTTKTTTLPPSF